jgi:hypothetical protein
VLEHGKPVADASADVDPAGADQAAPCSAVIHFGQIVRRKFVKSQLRKGQDAKKHAKAVWIATQCDLPWY